MTVTNERLDEIVSYVEMMGPNCSPVIIGGEAAEMATELRSLRTQTAGEAVAWQVEHRGGATFWNVEANATSNAKATGGTVRPLFTHPKPVEVGVLEMLQELRAELEAYEAEASGEGYNKPALNDVISRFKAAQDATLTDTTKDGVTDEHVVAIGRLYGNYIDGHGWTGFGPRPEDIEAILSTLTDTAKGVEVTEDMVDAAIAVWFGSGVVAPKDNPTHRVTMRAAITASLSGVQPND